MKRKWEDRLILWGGCIAILAIASWQVYLNWPARIIVAPAIVKPQPSITAEPQGWQGLPKPQVVTNPTPDCPVAIEIEYTRQGDGYLLNEVQWAWMRDQIERGMNCK